MDRLFAKSIPDVSSRTINTISYFATDQNGLTTSATRTIIVEMAPTPESPNSKPVAYPERGHFADSCAAERKSGYQSLLQWTRQMSIALHLASLLGAIMLAMLAMTPVLSFYARGWAIKKNDIMSSFNTEAKKRYFKFFHGSQPDDPDSAFEQLYASRYGPKNLHVPMALLTIILIVLLFLVTETALSRVVVFHDGHRSLLGIQAAGPLFTLPPVAVAGIVGGFLWITSDLIQRCRTLNLSPGDLQNSALRLSMAAPMGYALGAVVNPSLGSFIAFAFGAFPLAQVSVIFRRLANRQAKLGADTDVIGGQLRKLEGIDGPTSDKLFDEGVTTVAQLAYHNPVQLCMRTGFDFVYIMDIAGQALSWIYLGEGLDKLRPLGLRGAIEFRKLYEDLSGKHKTTRMNAESLLAVAAAAAGISVQGFRNDVYQIALDPYTDFLDALWE